MSRDINFKGRSAARCLCKTGRFIETAPWPTWRLFASFPRNTGPFCQHEEKTEGELRSQNEQLVSLIQETAGHKRAELHARVQNGTPPFFPGLHYSCKKSAPGHKEPTHSQANAPIAAEPDRCSQPPFPTPEQICLWSASTQYRSDGINKAALEFISAPQNAVDATGNINWPSAHT